MITLTVNTLTNENDGIDLGNISLIEAVEAANVNPGQDLINFEDSLRGGTIDVNGTLNITDSVIITGLGKEDLDIDGTINLINLPVDTTTITGLTAENFVIEGSPVTFVSLNNVEARNVSISTIENGQVSIGLNDADVSGITTDRSASLVELIINESRISGDISLSATSYGTVNTLIRNTTIENAGIYNGGRYNNLRVENSVITGNNGSGIFVPPGFENDRIYGVNVNIKNSTISHNGGGIYLGKGNLTLENTNIEENNGNGIVIIRNPLSDVNIENSTIAKNGNNGIYNRGGTLEVSNSTISGNEQDGIHTFSYFDGKSTTPIEPLTTVTNSTITANRRGIFNDAYANIVVIGYNAISASTTDLVNSIVSGNQVDDVVNDIAQDSYYGGDIPGYNFIEAKGVFISGGNNIMGTGNGVTDFTETTDQINTDAKLNPLADNGGFTQTHLPQMDSPAIDAGNQESLPRDVNDLDGDGNTTEPILFDQRGVGFNRVVGSELDIGAVEVQSSSPRPNVIIGTLRSDNLVGTNQRDIISGLASGDTLTGLVGEDLLRGGPGRDTLNGGPGNDSLIGGRNDDTFVFSENFGNDTIRSFQLNGDDVIDISGFASLTFEDLVINNNLITSPTTTGFGQISLVNFRGELTSDDFILQPFSVT
ncbi:choice-of-anchor Q domain-containing protein [Gloeocapsa sp. PCC 73106]|uniref:choice-of-anchor Q domain-containing protein n=1 Tax=Gloeocapsa sp. PCC 73106 TaxID=102232 RepID=UPI0002AC64A1|nr:choice-of-anchor Q domain-containing protein [Gloeocapsa sp. PCC 73106]ELR96873.1 putative calcium-binding protein [Gloeocapsa sp. PCC 73106]